MRVKEYYPTSASFKVPTLILFKPKIEKKFAEVHVGTEIGMQVEIVNP